MTKNLFYRTVFRRENVLRTRVLDFFLLCASYPRMLIEVFIRKNFGERYFSYATAITITIVMIFYPIVMSQIPSYFREVFNLPTNAGGARLPGGGNFPGSVIFGNNPGGSNPSGDNPFNPNPHGQSQDDSSQSSNPYLKYLTWYLFVFGFFLMSYKRHQEVKRNPSVFDFERFSLSTGDIHPFYLNLKIAKGNLRAIEIFYEPLGFFIIGVVLWILGQSLGWLLVLASLCYCLSYAGAYERGDHFIMDKIDEMLLNEQMEAAFIHDEPSDKTKNMRFYARKPTSEQLRRRLTDAIVVEDDDVPEAE